VATTTSGSHAYPLRASANSAGSEPSGRTVAAKKLQPKSVAYAVSGLSAGIRIPDSSVSQNLQPCESKIRPGVAEDRKVRSCAGAHVATHPAYTTFLHCRVIWLWLILTLRLRCGLALPDGRATFTPCFTCFFRGPFVRHAPEMREFATLTRDFALSVAVHGRESALACRHLTSVVAETAVHCECHRQRFSRDVVSGCEAWLFCRLQFGISSRRTVSSCRHSATLAPDDVGAALSSDCGLALRCVRRGVDNLARRGSAGAGSVPRRLPPGHVDRPVVVFARLP
jgi:hypothetical protein